MTVGLTLALLTGTPKRVAELAARPGLVTQTFVADDLASGALVRVLPRLRMPSFRAYAALPSARHLPRRVRLFVDFLMSALR